LKEEVYLQKTQRPTAKDRELMALNSNQRIVKLDCYRCKRQFKPSEIEQNNIGKAEF